MKPDIPIIGQPSATNTLLSSELLAREIECIDANAKAFIGRMKVNELRKSCGVKDEIKLTVNVRKPPRYHR